MQRIELDAIGTKWRIETETPLDKEVRDCLVQRIELFDQTYSRFRDDSLVTQVAKYGGRHAFPDDAMRLFAFYRLLYEVTNGKVTPLVGNLLEDAGYDAAYSLRPKAVLQPAVAWEQVMWWDGAELFAHVPVMLDVGAAGKGYLVDLLAGILLTANISTFVIDASGDILHRSESIDRVGLEHPHNPRKIIGVAELSGRSLCASAVNRRAWGDLHHVFDPHTAQPAQKVVATWAIADSTMIADGLATALFFCEPDHLREAFDFEYVRVLQDGTIDHSPHFQGELYI